MNENEAEQIKNQDILTKFKWLYAKSLEPKEGLTTKEQQQRREKLKKTLETARWGHELEFDLFDVTQDEEIYIVRKPKQRRIHIKGTGVFDTPEYNSEMLHREGILDSAIEKELEKQDEIGDASETTRGKFLKTNRYI